MKKGLSLFLSLIIAFGVIAIIGNTPVCAATFDDLNQPDVFFKQTEGQDGCVVTACAMMIRRTLIGTGNSNWASVTESSLKGTACLSGTWRVKYATFSYMGVNVDHNSFNKSSATLQNLLASHPEGIVLFSTNVGHGVLVTDYTDGQFYAADPAPGYPSGRILLSQVQKVTISNATDYWYVSSPKVTLTTYYNPEGSVDAIEAGNGTISIWGWAVDKDSPETSIYVHVYVGGDSRTGEYHGILADYYRQDINDGYQISGNHGFFGTISTALTGEQIVYVYLYNIGGGENTEIWHGIVNIASPNPEPTSYNPEGSVDAIEGGNGTISIWGWALDRDSPDTSLYVHVYVGGDSRTGEYHSILANYYRQDINDGYQISGNHGFLGTISTALTGEQIVYVYLYNIGGGENTEIWHGLVNISSPNPEPSSYNPEGAVDVIVGGKGTISIWGWAIDQDSPETSIYVHVYVGGDSRTGEYHSVLADYYRQDINDGYQTNGNHGFLNTFSTGLTGEQIVYVYLYNIGGGENTEIWHGVVNITCPDYVLTYDANGGSRAPENQSGNGNITLSSELPQKEGFTFIGWSTSVNAEEAQYQPGDTYSLVENTTLFAIWKKTVILGDANGDGEIGLKDIVQITRYLAGGWDVTVDPAVADVNHDGEVNLKDAVILRRYLAGGWGIELK